MDPELLAHLEFIHGKEAAAEWIPRVVELIESHRPEREDQAAGCDTLPLSEKDFLLIAYGDQVREPEVPPIQSLGRFLETAAGGVVQGVHLLPFYPSSSDDGFSVIDYRRVDPALGSWDDVRRLSERFPLMFDAVFNHVSSQSLWFRGFLKGDANYSDYFVVIEGEPDLSAVVRPRALPLLTEVETATGMKRVWTTFSPDQIDLNAANPEVLLELLDVLCFYVSQGARWIRLDAIAFLWKEIGTSCLHLPKTHRIVQLMRSVLERVAPGAMIITETNVPHEDNISYFGDGANEAQLVYNFALPPLVMHAILKGNTAYLSGWAKTLRPLSRKTAFFNFLASHDGIGVNPARGILPEADIEYLARIAQEHGGYVSYKNNADGTRSAYELNVNYFDALSDPNDLGESVDLKARRFIAAQAAMLSLAGLPGIYFHSLFGSQNDREGAERSGIPRRINRQKFERAVLEEELKDPGSVRYKVFHGYRRLLQVRSAHPCFHPCGAQEVLDLDSRVFALARASLDENETALCLHNFSNEEIRVELPPAWRAGTNERWSDWLDFDRTGMKHPGSSALKDAVVLRPYGIFWGTRVE